MNLFCLEQETETSLLAKALSKDGFPFEVTDTREELLWKYLGTVHEQLPTTEQELLADPVFEVLYLTAREELEVMLGAKSIYLGEEVNRILLLLVINYTNNECMKSLNYFAAHAPPEAIAAFLSWEGMTYAVARALYARYPGERTEELVLTLEVYGFEAVLDQAIPTDVLQKLFDLSLLPERAVLRRTCRRLAEHKAPPDSLFAPPLVSLFAPNMPFKVMRLLAVDSAFLRVIQHSEESVVYLQNKIPTLVRFCLLVKLLIADDHPKAERLLFPFAKYYAEQHEGKQYEDRKRKYIAYKLNELKDILLRAEGLKPTPTLLRCLGWVDNVLCTYN